MTESTTTLHASTPQLLRASALALAAAGTILLIAVLPAEYGIDPTGIGKSLGLTALHTPAAEAVAVEGAANVVAPPAMPAEAPAAEPAASVVQQPKPFQNAEMTLTLQANEGAEIKAQMRAGDSFVFSWVSAGGPVNFDMHGEKPNDGDNFTSYWKDREKTAGHGSFTAPFDGSQGWYWRNRGSAPVTITLKISGYFQKLYRP